MKTQQNIKHNTSNEKDGQLESHQKKHGEHNIENYKDEQHGNHQKQL